MRDSYWKHMVPRQLSRPRKKLVLSKTEGKKDDAEIWRHVEAALKLMRGPHES